MENIEKIAELEAVELTEEELNSVDGGYVQYKLPPRKTGYFIYRIEHGDTLSKIGNRFNVTVRQLMSWNPYIENRNKIYTGAYLYIRM